jgi:hypothetical protein
MGEHGKWDVRVQRPIGRYGVLKLEDGMTEVGDTKVKRREG